MDNKIETFDDDAGTWESAGFFSIFKDWRLLISGLFTVVFWVLLFLSLFGVWAVPAKAVLIWGFESLLILTVIFSLSK